MWPISNVHHVLTVCVLFLASPQNIFRFSCSICFFKDFFKQLYNSIELLQTVQKYVHFLCRGLGTAWGKFELSNCVTSILGGWCTFSTRFADINCIEMSYKLEHVPRCVRCCPQNLKIPNLLRFWADFEWQL